MKHIIQYLLLLIAIPLYAGRIHDAAYHQDLKTVKEIAKKNPKAVNERDSLGRTPLHYAAWDINYEITKYLIKRGANINALDSEGYTAIHKCFYWDSVMVVLLLKNGANITIADTNAHSLLNDVAADIWDKYSKPYPPSEKMIKQLLDNPNDVNARGKVRQTPLHSAVYYCNYKLAKQLIEHGADVNARDTSGATPLNYYRDRKYFMVPFGIGTTCGFDSIGDLVRERMKTDGEKLLTLLLSHGAEYKEVTHPTIK